MSDLQMPFALKPSAVVVYEGLDATGKTTQMERMEAGVYRPSYGTPMFDGSPVFLHMPSGSNKLGAMVYDYTEKAKRIEPFARQLLHLAVHAEEVDGAILPALQSGQAVFLDRFWWSTVAYGWEGLRGRFSKRALRDLCQAVWAGVEPDVVYLFLEPHKHDRHNTRHVRRGYEWLAEEFSDIVTLVPSGELEDGTELHEANVQLFIMEDMVRRGIYGNGGK